MNSLTELANRYGSDKGTTTLCAHGYTRVYESLLGPAREQPLRLAEIGLMHGYRQYEFAGRLAEAGCASLRMWADYLPQATIDGFDLVDFRALAGGRVRIHQGDQGRREDLAAFAEAAGGAFDVIIDDGSHASQHQQITLATLFPRLAPGGFYLIEDLHYQPAELELPGITPTREFLRQLRHGGSGAQLALHQDELAGLLATIGSIHFFDSQSSRWPLAQTEDALALIVKKGAHPTLRLAAALPGAPRID